MLPPAAPHRALAGALACAFAIFCASARADDLDMREAFRAPQGPLSGAATRTPPLVAAALRDLGRGKFTSKPGPWCADAAGAWLRRAGHVAPPTRRARDFARYGRPTTPRPGALVVSRHHVGVVVSVERGRVTMVSGNWGGRVRLGRPTGVIAYRAPI